MKRIYALLFLITATGAFAQLTIKPTDAGSDVFLYARNTNVFVTGEMNLQPNSNTGDSDLSQDIANFYLRNEAQLIQGFASGPNTGNGAISVFQEGTVDAFEYNYWGSPVGEATGTGNSDFGITLLNRPLNTVFSDAIAVGGINFNGFTSETNLNIAGFWINKFIGDINAPFGTGEGYEDWIQVSAATSIEPGEGFTMKGTNGTDTTTLPQETASQVQNNPGGSQRYDFRGRPRNGTININVNLGEEYLVGNPYPSSLDLNYFLLYNSGSDVSTCTSSAVTPRNNITGTAFFWYQDDTVNSHNIQAYQGGYGAYSPGPDCNSTGTFVDPIYFMYDADGNPVGPGTTVDQIDNRSTIPLAQGFFVEGADSDNFDGSQLQFTNDMRVFEQEEGDVIFTLTDGDDNEDLPNKNSDAENNSSDDVVVYPKFYLDIVFNDTYTRRIASSFHNEATIGYDKSMDAKNFDKELRSDAGWNIDNEKFVINMLPFNEDAIISLLIETEDNTEIDFSVNKFENFETENIFIYDKLTGIYHDVKNDIFTIILDEGVYTDRFKLTFKDNSGVLAINEELADSFSIYQNNAAQLLEIKNPNTLDISLIEVYDIAGKKVITKSGTGAVRDIQISTVNLSQSTYIVRINTVNNIQRTQKVIIAKN
ncbi:T9SS sorting signal type C domain-containing protein [Gangjinia marincola]|uniref:T9SS sorting signal type C domain-containing protein n=1 Tax=Gangjinia marincola TaxID=578463 RepID=A0ABN1MGA8_9FLAO